jgi:Ser/Thr protein kinase RdoA (MazF antagonist)
MHFTPPTLDWLAHQTRIPVSGLAIVRLSGSTSSAIYVVRQASDPAPRFVLRVLDNREWLAEEPDLAAHEAAALVEAEGAGLHAPRLVAYAEEEIGFGVPVILMSYLAGRVELQPANFEEWLAAIAAELARIHQHTAEGFGWRWRSWVNRAALGVPAWTARPALWQKAIDFWLQGEPPYNPVFIHRDFHPTNLVWQHGAISGVVDWINACRGPAGADVAHCRTNLALAYGPHRAAQFLAAYHAASPAYRHEAYWDVDSVLDMCVAGPAFYEPWHEFGLNRVEPTQLRQRIDEHLALCLP